MSVIRDKVVVYITRGDELLVMTHPDSPEVGLQVPAGGIEPQEGPDAAAVREAVEETGLHEFRFVRHLGHASHDMRPFARRQEERHFVHLEYLHQTEPRWRHHELSASTGESVLLEFEWMRLDGSDLGLSAGQGRLVHLLSNEAFPTTRRRLVEHYQSLIAAHRATALEKLIGAVAQLHAAGGGFLAPQAMGPAMFAAYQHFVYLLRAAATTNDQAAAAAVSAAWSRSELQNWLREARVIVVGREDCTTVNDPRFESPLHLLCFERLERTARDPSVIADAFAALRRKGYADLVDSTLGVAVFMRARASLDETESYTVSALRGTVFIDHVADTIRLAELLLHESAHNWLNDAFSAARVSLSPDAVYWSPWRQRLRPAYGILHAAWAFSWLSQWFAEFANDTSVPRSTRLYCAERLSAEVSTLSECMDTLVKVLGEVHDGAFRGLLLEEVNRAMQSDTRCVVG